MIEVLYPELEFCLTCWKRLDIKKTHVIKRRWCSYECARMRTPDENPARWPRKCLTRQGYPKIKFTHPEQITAKSDVHTYECSYCGYYHIGHKPVEAQRGR